jgi:hypothetical protein
MAPSERIGDCEPILMAGVGAQLIRGGQLQMKLLTMPAKIVMLADRSDEGQRVQPPEPARTLHI